MMKKILVPYDFSEEADYALDAAQKLAKIDGSSELHIVHVIEIPSSYLSLYPEYSVLGVDSVFNDEIIEKVNKRLDQLVEKLEKDGEQVTGKLLFGKPFERIQDTIIKEESDLIIMGSKGATGLKEIFVGSTTERVIRYAKVPVLTVKSKVDFSTMSDVVLATDFTVDKSVQLVKRIQSMLGLKIRLLKVYNSNEWAFTERTAMEKLNEFAIEGMFKDYSLHVVDSPFVTDGILEFSHKQKSDLIVMGTHGYTGIGHLVAGSRAEGVANHSKIPIFTVHK